MAARYKWYVYELVDPRDGKVFYVGKGCNNRVHNHEKEAKRGIDSHKCRKIRSIWSDGLSVLKNKVAYFNDEQFAYVVEADRIAEYGLKNLTNEVLSCTLVSNKTLIEDKSERAFAVIKMLAKHFATWLKCTKYGELKAVVDGVNSDMCFYVEEFYNKNAKNIFDKAIESEFTAKKVIKLMRKFNIELTITRAA